MAKIEMHVIPEEAVGDREVYRSSSPGSVAVGGRAQSKHKLVCGRCRDILAPDIALDTAIVEEYIEATDSFRTVLRFQDVVIKCKGCGAYNEPPGHQA